ncbi:MAG: DeoR family transcriptional regulator, partial [Acetobacteraceae bacterium]
MRSEPAGLAPARQQEILRRALAAKLVRVKDLANDFGVHEMTVRRDLETLAEQGMLERVHGGARLRERMSEELSHQLRAARNTEAKARIARAALALVDDGDTVALDASTTALALARILHARKAAAIVSGLDAAEELAQSGVPFELVGGTFN